MARLRRSVESIVRRLVRRNPILWGMTLALLISSGALGLVLDEQSKGRERDRKLSSVDRGLASVVRDLEHDGRRIETAFTRIQAGRVERIKLICRLNREQNDVLLAIIDFSIKRAQSQGRSPPAEVLDKTNELLRPITRKATREKCRALLAGVSSTP